MGEPYPGHQAPIVLRWWCLMPAMQRLIRSAPRAQGLVEYGLIIALVAVLAIAGLLIFGPAVSSQLSNLGASV
jgi:Flp pilus assembly pilin Flp